MDDLELLIDFHRGTPRQGPGGDAETLRALDLCRLDPSASLEVADLGCGTGTSTLLLARTLNARIAALDFAPAFIEELRALAERDGLAERIEAQVGDMASLPFADERFDLIWSEGAIYNIGFEVGLRAWRPLLRPGGVLAVSELSWKTDTRPVAIEAHWTREYPGIATASSNLRTLERAGYRPLGCFFLPDRCWDENYYAPLRAGFASFLARHEHSAAARSLIEAVEEEMRLFDRYRDWYGYAFYIAQRFDAGTA